MKIPNNGRELESVCKLFPYLSIGVLKNFNVRSPIIIWCDWLAFLVVVFGFQNRKDKDNDVRKMGEHVNSPIFLGKQR